MAQAFRWFGKSSKPEIKLMSNTRQLISWRELALPKVKECSENRSELTLADDANASDPRHNNDAVPATRFRTLVLSTLAAVAFVAQTSKVHADNSHVVTSTSTKQPAPVQGGETGFESRAPVRTWLDPLRQSQKKKTSSSVVGQQAGKSADEDFDLSEYSQAPDQKASVVNVPSRGLVRRTTHTQDLDAAPLNEPAEPMNGEEEIVIPDSTTEQTFFPPTMPETVFSDCPQNCEEHLCWQLLPNGLLYKTYLAGEKEPRMQLVSFYDTKSKRKIWEAVLGGRAGLIRLSDPSVSNGDAFQVDLEGAVFARVLPDEPSAMLEGSDYRVGLYGTWKLDRVSYRAGYYHISSHVGDEFLVANNWFKRINYVRDSLLAGAAYELSDVSRVYGEIGYAMGTDGGAKPLEFQFGAEYSPLPTTQFSGAPFTAVNAHLREDFDFGGGVNVVAGWGWQGEHSKRRLRLGVNYYNGPSLQYEFFDRWENLVGGGIWLDY